MAKSILRRLVCCRMLIGLCRPKMRSEITSVYDTFRQSLRVHLTECHVSEILIAGMAVCRWCHPFFLRRLCFSVYTGPLCCWVWSVRMNSGTRKCEVLHFLNPHERDNMSSEPYSCVTVRRIMRLMEGVSWSYCRCRDILVIKGSVGHRALNLQPFIGPSEIQVGWKQWYCSISLQGCWHINAF